MWLLVNPLTHLSQQLHKKFAGPDQRFLFYNGRAVIVL